MGGILDKQLRGVAVPYYGQIFGYNRSENSDQDISKTLSNPGTSGLALTDPSLSGCGDLYPIINGVQQNNYMLRILRPKFGQIIQAYLNIAITFAATEPSPKFNVSVGGSFASDNLTPNTPSSTFIASCMNVLHSPSGTPFTGAAGQPLTFIINIQSLIPQVGAANYEADFYSLGLHFPVAPTMSGLFHLTQLFVTGSILVT